MKYLETYLNNICDFSLPIINPHPGNIHHIIIIPAYNEIFQDIDDCLKSLLNQNPHKSALVLLLINYKKQDSLEIKQASKELFQKLNKHYHSKK